MKRLFANVIKSLVFTSLFFFTNSALANKKLYVYNWTDYIPSSLIADFTKETGIEVIYSTFESNEEMYAKLKLLSKNSGYDLVFPSSYYINKMVKDGMLQKLDHAKLTNLHQIPTHLLNKEFDPQNQYSLPYIYGLTGIGLNAEEIDPSKITSWADLWKPEYKGKVLLTSDAREVFHIALLLNGKSPNTTKELEIKQAYEKLVKLMPNVLVFNSDSPEVPYVQGEVALGMIWNGSAYLGNKENSNIQFIYPKEGAIFWMDNYAIPKKAKNVEGAYQFIDFLLRPENAKIVIERMGFSMPNEGVKHLLAPEMVNNPVLFPPAEEVEKGIMQGDVGRAVDIYEKYWNKLKTN
ncbi:TPA: extracellular solute-binding protein [Pasteurella multocida]|uniref:extracellular solute-binding protein n=1 Tax=Pasteurella multocida TaxID=747 RepID=UPI0007ED3A3E|nr:extracellular solute-binding protein [Pasteurella multocida]MCL7840798.1 extracellular solute-binding protein [Pasteurella multocida]OBP33355.1 spermidine/putrescine ABC transporter substrate-binding protein [Pasteurella multocida subsp. multocida]PNM10950.1 spermidine/putrescine ABC transporter substrate-binding protein [Pasteurella multocida]HDR1000525.1 extracellular solute-binding protein [Pasteurella multocida]HDR1019538.1 extracellular solute-binding protein [Pasteurella multocida]